MALKAKSESKFAIVFASFKTFIFIYSLFFLIFPLKSSSFLVFIFCISFSLINLNLGLLFIFVSNFINVSINILHLLKIVFVKSTEKFPI